MLNSPVWPELRPFQEEALQSLSKLRHTLLLAPTGAGKSLIFQRYLHDHLPHVRGVLVTPLVALGRQQIQRLEQLGVPVWCGVGDARRVRFPDGGSGVWVVSPERLMHQEERLFESWKPNFFIFDEAHCVFDWGEEFRPAFQLLQDLFHRRTIEKSFWCSATLRQEMIRSIVATCGKETRVLGRFEVPSQIQIHRRYQIGDEKLDWLSRYVHQYPDLSGIIYAGTRILAERLAEFLRGVNREVWVYHAGMSSEERGALEQKIDQAHRTGQAFLVIATSAFGMGMDYPRLRFAVIFDPPYSVLQLAQALGRVGRSGDRAEVHCLWNRHDFVRLKFHCRGRRRGLDEVERLQRWYESELSAREALQKDFRDFAPSGTLTLA